MQCWLTFSEKTTTTVYLATMEKSPPSLETSENAMFLNMNSSKKLAFYNHTAGEGSVYSYKLRGSSGEVVGPAKSMEVQAGDLVDLEVFARYTNLTSTNSSVSTLLTSLIGAFSLNPSGGTGLTGEDAYNSFSSMFSGGPVVGNALEYEDEEAPKAYLNYILFDKDFIPVDFGFDQVSESAASAHELLSLHVKVRQAGYLYVFLSNENDKIVDVWFDDFKIVHHTAVEQSNDYYAFGQVIGSLSFNKGGVDNKYLYNGKELQDELDLGWYDYGARMYMSDIGRWGAFDPMAEETRRLTPYNYALNNPLRYIDPDGMLSEQPSEQQMDWDKELEEYAARLNERDAAIEKYGYRAYAIMVLEGKKVTTEKKKKAEGNSESNTSNEVVSQPENEKVDQQATMEEKTTGENQVDNDETSAPMPSSLELKSANARMEWWIETTYYPFVNTVHETTPPATVKVAVVLFYDEEGNLSDIITEGRKYTHDSYSWADVTLKVDPIVSDEFLEVIRASISVHNGTAYQDKTALQKYWEFITTWEPGRSIFQKPKKTLEAAAPTR